MNELEIQRKQGKKSSRVVWERKIRQLTKINPHRGGGELRRKGRRRADEQMGLNPENPTWRKKKDGAEKERPDWRNTRRSAATQTEKGIKISRC
jgi:hypothetical protein